MGKKDKSSGGGNGSGGGGGGKAGGGKAPIFAAIDAEDTRAVAAQLPASLEAKNGDGWTPLLAAAYVGSAELVDILLRAGAAVNAVCNDGCTAAHYASAQGAADVLRRLAAAPGARLAVADKDGETPEDVAQGKKIKTLVAALIAEQEAAAEREGDDGGEEEEGDDDAEGAP